MEYVHPLYPPSILPLFSKYPHPITSSPILVSLLALPPFIYCVVAMETILSIIFLFKSLRGFNSFSYDLVSLRISFISSSFCWRCFHWVFSSTLDFFNASFHTSLDASSSQIFPFMIGNFHSFGHFLIIFSMACSSSLYSHGWHSLSRSLCIYK